MLIVLEGCDGSGKTTLANMLAPILNAEVMHFTTKTPNDYRCFHAVIQASRTRNIIADRFCYGQFVYQSPEDRPLNDGREREDNSERALQQLEGEMVEAGAKVVYVWATPEDIKRRLISREESLINGLTVEEIQKRFSRLFAKSILPVQYVCTSGVGLTLERSN